MGDDSKSTPDFMPEGFSKRDVENMGGSLKVHVRLALKADIRIIAEIKGDIVSSAQTFVPQLQERLLSLCHPWSKLTEIRR